MQDISLTATIQYSMANIQVCSWLKMTVTSGNVRKVMAESLGVALCDLRFVKNLSNFGMGVSGNFNNSGMCDLIRFFLSFEDIKSKYTKKDKQE